MPQTGSILPATAATRFRGIGRIRALAIALAVVAAVVALLCVAAGTHAPLGAAAASGNQGDAATYDTIVERMRQGEGYYPAAHAELLGGTYGTRSVFNWRLPTLSWLLSHLPSLAWAQAFLSIAALLAIFLSFRLVRAGGDRIASLLIIPALAISLVACAAPAASLFADVVAGVLILLSAAAYGLRLPVAGFCAAILALFVRELAAPYVLICVFLAGRDRHRSELPAWLIGLLAFGAYFVWHYRMVQAQLGPADIGYPEGWVQFGGAAFALSTAAFNGLLLMAPTWVTAILLPLCLLGLVAWRDPAAGRITMAVIVYLLLFTVVGKSFDIYWGALYTPLMMFGLPFVPAALRDLIASIRAPTPILGGSASGMA